MAVAVERRLAGIRFERRPPPLELVLPRMDVAGFVGLAASGPLHTPVAVEDAAEFEALFGADAPLALDPVSGSPAPAYLGPAVRAFFRNGGRRCWIVRVAGEAEYDRFDVPGLVQVGPDGLQPAVLRARSEGSWADGLRVATALESTTLALEAAAASSVTFSVSRPDELAAGDLIRITTNDDVYLFAVASVGPVPVSPVPSSRRVLVEATPVPGAVFFLPAATPGAGSVCAAVYRDDGGRQQTVEALTAVEDANFALDVPSGGTPPAAGSLVTVEVGSQRLWLSVDRSHAIEDLGSPLTSGLRIVGTAFAPVPVAGLPAGLGPGDHAERLTFELRVRRGAGDDWRLADLGFVPVHPRFVADLPTDRDLYRSREGELVLDPPPIWEAAAGPRFPLAVGGDLPLVYLPLGMQLLPHAFTGPHAAEASALERDGLQSFEASIFLDEDLAQSGVRTLAETAEFLRFKADRPRTLRGLHALLPVEEVTIAAVPDAIQRAWEPAVLPPVPPPKASDPLVRPEWWHFLPCTPPAAPQPGDVPFSEHYLCNTERLPDAIALAATAPDAHGAFALSWTPAANASEYVLEEAVDPGWSDATVAHSGPQTTRIVTGRIGLHYYRVRGESSSGSTDWSNPVAVTAPVKEARAVAEPEWGHFLDCSVRVIDPPVLEIPLADDSGTYTVSWLPIDEPDAVYVLEEATDHGWATAETVYEGTALFRQFFGRPPGLHYYRVRALVAAASSDWSAGVVVRVAPAKGWALEPVAAYDAAARDTLLTIQSKLLRMCAARGDMLAVLALPAHYREDDAIAHVHALTGMEDESRTLSFGAVYHPWLTTETAGQPGTYQLVPPDGAAAGVIARRTIARGAWIAPANEAIRDVVVLNPRLREQELLPLQIAQVNVVRQEARGFLSLSADTLSPDEDLRPIGVRRLLSLLRRAALLNGVRYVFEPNDDILRRSIERGFGGLLARLYTRGAFAGATADEAYQVVIGSPPNTQETLDSGQLIVELKVAPSLPLTFLTVRLVQAGEGGLTVESR